MHGKLDSNNEESDIIHISSTLAFLRLNTCIRTHTKLKTH